MLHGKLSSDNSSQNYSVASCSLVHWTKIFYYGPKRSPFRCFSASVEQDIFNFRWPRVIYCTEELTSIMVPKRSSFIFPKTSLNIFPETALVINTVLVCKNTLKLSYFNITSESSKNLIIEFRCGHFYFGATVSANY